MFAESLGLYFKDFGVQAQLGNDPVTGIFDSPYALAEGGFGAACLKPTFVCRTNCIPEEPVGASLLLAGVAYTIVEHQPDGTGVSTLLLERV